MQKLLLGVGHSTPSRHPSPMSSTNQGREFRRASGRGVFHGAPRPPIWMPPTRWKSCVRRLVSENGGLLAGILRSFGSGAGRVPGGPSTREWGRALEEPERSHNMAVALWGSYWSATILNSSHSEMLVAVSGGIFEQTSCSVENLGALFFFAFSLSLCLPLSLPIHLGM